ncbi:Non-classical phosphatidylinositol transfer protein (PITP) [Coemansia sp. Benny D115]|nr:Non-classical phosphatidylinositol transfer protein (PITP) [Coemansia sp. Benny D115]
MTDTAATEPKVGKAQHFTDAQSELIAKLRGQLPEIVDEAKKATQEPFSSTLWGVPLLPSSDGAASAGSRDLRVDVILHKFIKARNNDVALAREMLKNTLVWRADFHVANILDEVFPEDVFGGVGYIYGSDKEGRPVTYNTYGNLDNALVFGDLDRFLRWRVQLHERGMSKLDFVDVADMVQVHDYDGVGLLSYDKSAKAASKATVQLMSDNYPETLAVKIFANVPFWGETIFNIVCRWLSEETKKKFVVASKSSAPRVLAERIGAENLPPKFSTAKPEPSKKSQIDEPSQHQQSPQQPQPPQPEPAHQDPADTQPEPTTSAAVENTDSDDGNSQRASPPSQLPPPPEAVVTDAPESPKSQAEELESQTAGMRIDDKTDSLEEAATEPKKAEETAAAHAVATHPQ